MLIHEQGPAVLLTSREVGKILGVNFKVCERWAKAGRLPGFKVGKFWRYRPHDLDEWMQATVESQGQPCRIETQM